MIVSIHFFQIHITVYASEIVQPTHSVSPESWIMYSILLYSDWILKCLLTGSEKWNGEMLKWNVCDWKISKLTLKVCSWPWKRWKLDMLRTGDNSSIGPYLLFHSIYYSILKVKVYCISSAPSLHWMFLSKIANCWSVSQIWASLLSCMHTGF